MSIGRPVQLVRRMHHLVAERGGGVAEQGHVITELHGEAAGGLNAGVGEQTDGNDMRDATLLEMKIEIRIGEGAPGVLRDFVISRLNIQLRNEVGPVRRKITHAARLLVTARRAAGDIHQNDRQTELWNADAPGDSGKQEATR